MVEQYNQNFINQDGDAIFLTPTEENVILHGGGGRIYFVDATQVPGPTLTISLPFSGEAGYNAEITVVGIIDSEQGGAQTIVLETQAGDNPLKAAETVSPAEITTTDTNLTVTSDGLLSWFVTAFVS